MLSKQCKNIFVIIIQRARKYHVVLEILGVGSALVLPNAVLFSII